MNKVMTFGTPHQGLSTLCIFVVGLFCPNAFQLDDDSDWISQLNNGFPLPDLESSDIDYFFVAGDRVFTANLVQSERVVPPVKLATAL